MSMTMSMSETRTGVSKSQSATQRRSLFDREWQVPWHAQLTPLLLAGIITAIWLLVPTAEIMQGWALSRDSLRQGHAVPLILYVFAHGSWLHVSLNVASLLLLSAPVVSRLGAPPISWGRYLYIFFGSGLSGAAFFLLFGHDPAARMLGASGAIFGLLGALARVHPLTGETVPIRSPRTWSLVKLLVQNHIALLALLAALAILTGASASVAWQAHVGGLLFGFFAAPLYLPQRGTQLREKSQAALGQSLVTAEA